VSKKTAEELGVEIDERSLALAGWRVEDFRMPLKEVAELPVDLVDETTSPSIRPSSTVVAAHVRRAPEGSSDDIRVHLEGQFQFGSADELLADFAAKSSWNEMAAQDPESYPLEIHLPKLEVEILDETGFILRKEEADFYGRARIPEPGMSPGRPARWHAYVGDDLDGYAGRPARVVVRFVDGDD
jgi:hypothetical protein